MLKTHILIPSLVLVCVLGESAADERFAPRMRPFVKCDNEVPNGIQGTWRTDKHWTLRERAGNSSLVGEDGVEQSTSTSVMEITTTSITGLNVGLVDVERSYRVIGGAANKFLLELYDAVGETWTITLELVPCGLVVEAEANCVNQFCINLLREMFEKMATGSSSEDRSDLVRKSTERVLQELTEKPQVLMRTYYREVDIPSRR